MDVPAGLRGLRVLLTEDRPSYGVLAAARALRQAGVQVHVAVGEPDSFTDHSRAPVAILRVPSPMQDREAWARALAEHALRIGASAVLPGTEAGLVALAATRAWLPADLLLGVGSSEQVAAATTKRDLPARAAAVGLRAPQGVVVDLADPQTGVDGSPLPPWPVILKPLQSSVQSAAGGLQSAGATRVRDGAALRAELARLPGGRGLVQPWVAGGLEAVCGVAWQGEVVCSVHQRAERIYPVRVGISAFAETVAADPVLDRQVAALLADLGWSGIFQLQFLRSDDGLWLIDLNPRVYGSLGLAVSAGANLPAIWLSLLLGIRPDVPAYRVGARLRVEERDAALLIHLLRLGRLRTALLAARPRRGTAHAAFSWRDPGPLRTSLRRAWSRRAHLRAPLETG